MGLDLDGLDGAFREPSVIVDMTQPPPLEELPTQLMTVELGNDAWTEVPTLAPEHVHLRKPLRVGAVVACAALTLVSVPLGLHRWLRGTPALDRAAAAP